MTTPGGQWGGTPAGDFLRVMEEGFRRLERSLENIQAQLTRLPRDYVSRVEFDRYRDEHMIDMASGLNRHERDIADVKTEMRDIQHAATEKADKGRTQRLALINLGLVLLLGVPGCLYALFHLH